MKGVQGDRPGHGKEWKGKNDDTSIHKLHARIGSRRLDGAGRAGTETAYALDTGRCRFKSFPRASTGHKTRLGLERR